MLGLRGSAIRSTPTTRHVTLVVHLLFFGSGALGLIYEILWLRKLLLVFGSTVYAVSTILAVFFGGLAIGSWVFGRLSDRYPAQGLRWYAVCEILIGGFAALTPLLFHVVERFYLPLYRASGFSQPVFIASALVCSSVVLLVPTILMGATLPLLSRWLVRVLEGRGAAVALLYGVNAFGAMAGTMLVYTIGLQRFGWSVSLYGAALSNTLIGMIAWRLNRRIAWSPASSEPPSPSAQRQSEERMASNGASVLLAAFGLSGFSAMVYEVTWTRSLSLVVGSSVYAFGLMLAAFLGGIALGSLWARRYLQRHPAGVNHFVILEQFLGLYGLFAIGWFASLPDWFVVLWRAAGGSFLGWTWTQGVVSIAVMALPTLVMGALFPVVSELMIRRMPRFGRDLGAVYAVNTVGGIVGSLACGFWLVPQIGLAWTMCVAAIVNTVAAMAVYVRLAGGARSRRIAIAGGYTLYAILLGTFVFVPSWKRHVLAEGAYLRPERYRGVKVSDVARSDALLFYREGVNSTVSVHRVGEHLYLKVGAKTDASIGTDMGTQVLVAHIPLLLHENAKEVLVIGLGSGVTLGSAGRYPVATLHGVEIEPAVIEASRFFAEHNYRVHDDPRTRLHVADGRNFLLANPASYDVIISEPSNPWMAGIGNLFTEEFYQLCRRRLADGGLMAQWLHISKLFPSDLKMVLKTFHAVFPYVSVWSTIAGDVLFVGSLDPHRFDLEHARRVMDESPGIRNDLKRVHVTDPDVLTEFFLFDQTQVELMVADTPAVHRDDWPALEFSAPKALYRDDLSQVNYDGFERLRASASPVLPGGRPAVSSSASAMALGEAYRFREETNKAIDAFKQAAALDPGAPEPYLRLGEFYISEHSFVKAHEALTQALHLDHQLSEAHRLMGRLLVQQKKLKDALVSYDQAARVRRPDVRLAQEIGSALAEDHQWLAAAEYFRSASSLMADTDDPLRPHLVFGRALRKSGAWTDAEAMLRHARHRYPDEPGFTLLLAEVLHAQGHLAEARSLFHEVLGRAPQTAAAMLGLGRIAASEGDFRTARRYLMDGLQYDPYNVEALELLQDCEGN